MIEIQGKDMDWSLYTNTVLDKDSIYYSKVSTDKTEHIINFELSDFCSPEAEEHMSEKVIPLFHLDLQALNKNLSGKVPVFYHEMVWMDWLVSELDEEGKVIDSYLVTADGEQLSFNEIEEDEDEIFEEGADEIKSHLDESYSGSCISIWSKPPISELGDLTEDDFEKYDECVHKSWIECLEHIRESEGYQEKDPEHWGPFPIPIQNNFHIPIDVDTKEEFVFLGQIKPSDAFGLCDMKYFIFYHEKSKTVAQLMQMT